MTNHKPPLPPEEAHDSRVETGFDADVAVEERAPAARPVPPVPSFEHAPPPPPAAPAATFAPRPYGDPLAKSPGLALFLSILVPGLGHIYVGSYERALMILGGIAVSIWAMVQSDGELWPLAFAIAFAYFFSIFDAYREAQIVNLAGQELPKPQRQGEGRLMFGIFLTVVAALVLADNLGLFDIRWFYQWWPVLILLIGLYFIGSWIWEKMNAGGGNSTSSHDDDSF
jgi:hypothetical protein